jgi:alpha-galactosidase
VAADRSSAAFAYVQLATPTAMAPPRLRFPGLDPERSYTLSLCAELRPPSWPGRQTTEWITRGSVTLSGVALESYGVAAPPLHPADAVVMELRAL